MVRSPAISVAAIFGVANALDNGLAKTPPMGFNGYFAHVGGEVGLGAVADFLVSSGMRDSGYIYVNTDEGWESRHRDADGRLQWSTSAYPSGLPTFIDKLHKQGLKYGIYGSASGVTCGTMPGQLYNEDIDAQSYASWGVDFLKSDNCASYALDPSVRFGAMRDALKRARRPMLLSIEPFSITPDPAQSVKVSNMARIGKDCGSFGCAIVRADISDKWSPLAQPGYWNDPDTIELSNSLGSKNRVWFGMWSIMKAPLLLSAELSKLDADVIAIANNTEVIAVNQDTLGVQARKLSIDGHVLPWLVGLEDCEARAHSYSRNFVTQETQDRRAWTLEKVAPAPSPAPAPECELDCKVCTDQDGSHYNWYERYNGQPAIDHYCQCCGGTQEQQDVCKVTCILPTPGPTPTGDRYLIHNGATGRCLASAGARIVLLPCNASSGAQLWVFGKGVTTVSSITNLAAGLALAVGNETLYAQTYGKDAFPTPSASYGHNGLVLVPPNDQQGCSGRSCENYDHTQMWYYDEEEGLLRQSTFVASINHGDVGDIYRLTPRVPTYRHHCLAHVLSDTNAGTQSGTTEFWGGPLSNGDFLVGLWNRGHSAVSITADIELLESAKGSFKVRDLWAHADDDGVVEGSFHRTIAGNDLGLYRLTPSKEDVAAI